MTSKKIGETKPLVAQKWEPKTKAEEHMLAKYRSWSKKARSAEAFRLIDEEGETVSHAARVTGISRAGLSRAYNEAKREREAAESNREERIEAAKAEKAQMSDEVPDMLPGPTATTKRIVPTFREFNQRYFGNEICPDCGVHHDTPEFHGEMMDILEAKTPRMKLFNLAPYHAKSTTCTFKSTLYAIVEDPSSRTAIISAGKDLAEAMLYQIKEHLTDEQLYWGAEGNLIEDYGPFYNQGTWGSDSIYIAGRSGAQKDPTVSVYGYGSKIYGRRFDRMIFDDVADLDNQLTPESVGKMHRKIWQEYANRVGKTGQLIFVGTRVQPGDVYTMLEKVDGMNVFRRPCIIDEESGEMLWGEHFPLSSAQSYRSAMSLVDFQLVYQNIESAGFGASFPPDVVERAHDGDRGQGHVPENLYVVIGLDPAGSGKQAGYTAMICAGVDLITGRRYLIDLVNQRQMKAPQTMDQIYEWCERYPVRELRVEINGLQAQIYQYNQELQNRLVNYGVRLSPHITSKSNKWDPQFGVESMGPMYYNNQVSTPWGDINSREKFKMLDEQLMQFPVGTPNDLVMAWWFAELGLREAFQRQQVPHYDPRVALPARLRGKRRIINFGDNTSRQPDSSDLEGTALHGSPAGQKVQRIANMPGVVVTG